MKRLRCFPGRLWHQSRGAAGLEAALILPLFIFFIVGMVELYQQYRAQGIIDQAAAQIAHSVSQQSKLHENGSCTVADNICVYDNLAEAMFQPLDYTGNGRVVVSVYAAASAGPGSNFVWQLGNASGWTRSYPGSSGLTHANLGSTAGLPPARGGQSLIVVETLYRSTPFVLSAKFWGLVTGSRTLYSRAVARPLYGDLRQLRPGP